MLRWHVSLGILDARRRRILCRRQDWKSHCGGGEDAPTVLSNQAARGLAGLLLTNPPHFASWSTARSQRSSGAESTTPSLQLVGKTPNHLFLRMLNQKGFPGHWLTPSKRS